MNSDNYQEMFRAHRWKEPHEHVLKRVEEFKAWIMSRTETRIAVVAHSTFLRDLQGLSEKMPNCHIQEMDLFS